MLLRARAFGLEIDASFAVPGLSPVCAAGPFGPMTRLDLATREEIDAWWSEDGVTRVLEEHSQDEGTDAGPSRTIDVHPSLGYRLYARHFGLARISADGASVLCAPPEEEAPWSWQRFLVGRILPWAAVLRGFEVFHASAVAIDGRAIALTGPTGAGKTSLALRLVEQGAAFLTDDVLAVDRHDGELMAHPGAGIASVRPVERAAFSEVAWDGLGTVLGESDKTYVAVPRVERPLPLTAIFFVGRGDGPAVEPLASPDPRLLLGSTFVLGVQTPSRLRNQLDVCAAIARTVPAYRLRVAPGVDAATLAEMVREAAAAAGALR